MKVESQMAMSHICEQKKKKKSHYLPETDSSPQNYNTLFTHSHMVSNMYNFILGRTSPLNSTFLEDFTLQRG